MTVWWRGTRERGGAADVRPVVVAGVLRRAAVTARPPGAAVPAPRAAVCAELTAVRHGQSTANVTFAAAEAAGLVDSGIDGRDADVPLSPLGEAQAVALGRRLAAPPARRRPEVVLCSPYLRARQTWQFVLAVASGEHRAGLPEAQIEDRLRDRVMGELELLTSAGIAARFPAEAARRRGADEFSYRPPGGESMRDVAVRVAELLDDVHRDHAGRRVLLVTHDAVVLMLRHVVDAPVADLPALVRADPVANASISRWQCQGGRLRLAEYNSVTHLRDDSAARSRR